MEDGILTPPQARPRLLNGLTHRESGRRSAAPTQDATDTTSQRLAARMLQGWAMLAEHCPSRQQELECVTCNMPVQMPTAAAHPAPNPVATEAVAAAEDPESISTPRQEAPSLSVSSAASAPAAPAVQQPTAPEGSLPGSSPAGGTAIGQPVSRSLQVVHLGEPTAGEVPMASAGQPIGLLGATSAGGPQAAPFFNSLPTGQNPGVLVTGCGTPGLGGPPLAPFSADQPGSQAFGSRDVCPLDERSVFTATQRTILKKMDEARQALEATPPKDCSNLLTVLSQCSLTFRALQ
ncbi:hypothetical protein WJX84_011651 [Apatococcus fuscideae]|uniref:Uncharacterized protein n=1 Tax=Apatococcus fuscideae TaxID=2026836 RepID=A0AAW1SW31_9CHLO